MTSFGSDLLVAPNQIDFDSVFSNFGSLAENVAVLILISAILGGYIIGALWARRADKRDELLVSVFQSNTSFHTIEYQDIVLGIKTSEKRTGSKNWANNNM